MGAASAVKPFLWASGCVAPEAFRCLSREVSSLGSLPSVTRLEGPLRRLGEASELMVEVDFEAVGSSALWSLRLYFSEAGVLARWLLPPQGPAGEEVQLEALHRMQSTSWLQVVRAFDDIASGIAAAAPRPRLTPGAEMARRGAALYEKPWVEFLDPSLKRLLRRLQQGLVEPHRSCKRCLGYRPQAFHAGVSVGRRLLERLQVKEISSGVYSFPALSPEFCRLLLAEVSHFRGLQRANSMHRFGGVLAEMGLGSRVAEFQRQVTFNMALVQRTRGCRLVFCGLMQDRDVHQHRLSHQFPGEGWAVLHLGRQVHATEPIIQGERSNLVIWSRSWAWRAAGGDGQLPTVPPEMPGHAMCGRAKVSGFDAIFACPFGCHPACCFLLKAYWSSHGNKPQHPCKSKFFNQLLPRTPTNTPAKHTSNNGLLQPFPKCV
ncbi:unnamed protein product [Effrenium voratum]|nr:unnamed protein product [Effrenium voratum]